MSSTYGLSGYGVFEGQTQPRGARTYSTLRDVKGGVGSTIFRSLRHAGLGIHDVQLVLPTEIEICSI